MKSHRHGHPLALDYIALTLAALLWFAFLLSGTPSAPSMVSEPMPADLQSERAEEARIPRGCDDEPF